jgi:hypothetical protein
MREGENQISITVNGQSIVNGLPFKNECAGKEKDSCWIFSLVHPSIGAFDSPQPRFRSIMSASRPQFIRHVKIHTQANPGGKLNDPGASKKVNSFPFSIPRRFILESEYVFLFCFIWSVTNEYKSRRPACRPKPLIFGNIASCIKTWQDYPKSIPSAHNASL